MVIPRETTKAISHYTTEEWRQTRTLWILDVFKQALKWKKILGHDIPTGHQEKYEKKLNVQFFFFTLNETKETSSKQMGAVFQKGWEFKRDCSHR